ncbi:MAG: lasso RiPP family leader peptide-containing protein [Anaerolineae bacterium]
MSTKYEAPELKEFGNFQELTQFTFDGTTSDIPIIVNNINSPQGNFTTTMPGAVEK